MGFSTTTRTAIPATLEFARAAGVLTVEARRLGLAAPGFRSPPGPAGADRTIRRASWGAVVAVRLRGRPFEAALSDMIEGVVVANRLDRDTARRTRVLLLREAHRSLGTALDPPTTPTAEAA